MSYIRHPPVVTARITKSQTASTAIAGTAYAHKNAGFSHRSEIAARARKSDALSRRLPGCGHHL